MYSHLREREFYENLYDNTTISLCRRQERICVGAYNEALKKLKPLTGKDKDKDPKRELTKAFNFHYYFMVEWTAGERWEKRDQEIRKMMSEDEAKDTQIAEARLTFEPVCIHCGKTGLRITDKSLMHRDEHYKHDDPEGVLIMLECSACKKRSAVWQDGTPWERLITNCSKCNAVMKEKSTRKGKVITTTYACPACEHTYKDKLNLNRPKKSPEKPDPDYEKDEARFCLSEEAGKKYLEARRNLEGLQSVLEEMKERQDNKDVYDTIAQLKKPKIAELSGLLAPALKKAGYIEFSLDKPEMGRDVYVGFNCLDSKSDREDYQSRKTLKKLIDDVLEETNWRLMSDGISYRLGYLNGRLRAYEKEDDLKNLVMRSTKLKLKSKHRNNDATPETASKSLKTPDGREIIL